MSPRTRNLHSSSGIPREALARLASRTDEAIPRPAPGAAGDTDPDSALRTLLVALLDAHGDSVRALGERLVEAGAIDPAERDLALALAPLTRGLTTAAAAAPGPRLRLGELAAATGRLGVEALEQALLEHGNSGRPLGAILVQRGHLRPAEMEALLAFQDFQGGNFATPLRLGEVLVAAGIVSRSELQAALERQQHTGRRIGEELVAGGALPVECVQHGLALQRRMTHALLALVMALAALSPPAAVQGAGTTGENPAAVQLNFSITIPRLFNVRSVHQTRLLQVAAADIRRGYIELDNAAAYEVYTNIREGFQVSVASRSPIVTRVSVTGSRIELHTEGGAESMLVDTPSPGIFRYDFDFRLQLAPDVVPGAYPWPVQLTMAPV